MEVGSCQLQVDGSAEPDIFNERDTVMEEETSKCENGQAQTKDPFKKMLEVSVVMERLLSHLNFMDMKSFSSASKDSLIAVRKSTKFLKKAKLHLWNAVIDEYYLCTNTVIRTVPVESLEVLKETTYLWENTSLDLSVPLRVVRYISKILKNVTFLSLRLSSKWLVNDASMFDMADYLSETLKIASNIRELELDIDIMLNISLDDFFSSEEVRQVLGNLESLSIRNYSKEPKVIRNLQDTSEENTTFHLNMLQLSHLPLKLVKFSVDKVEFTHESELRCLNFIQDVVSKSSKTLKELKLPRQVWNLDGMKTIQCPELRCLSISCKSDKDSIVETFIQNQPPLEELVLETKEECPVSLIQCLRGRVQQMKRFHLKAKRFSGDVVPPDWGFLEEMRQLKEFFLRKPYDRNFQRGDTYGPGELIVRKLPSSVEKFTMVGVNPFWSSPSEDIGLLMERFEGLREFKLLRSFVTLKDEGFQNLLRNCTQLTSLAIYGCFFMRDYGISGVRTTVYGEMDDSGVSLLDIKGLVHLKLKSCNFSPECLLNVVKFNSLRSFEYDKVVKKEFLFQLVRQNPSLESLTIPINLRKEYEFDELDPDGLVRLKKDVNDINPRVHYIKIPPCMNDPCGNDPDSDSDADPMFED